MMREMREPIIDQCEGCGNIQPETSLCNVYVKPEVKWIPGKCPMSTHVVEEIQKDTKKVNPLKASKKKSRKK
jgi:hypothetical protein